MTLFAAEVAVMMWMLVGADLLSYSPSLTSSRFSLFPTVVHTTAAFSGGMCVTAPYYDDVVQECFVGTTPAYRHLWVPCFAFDTTLALLSFWAAVQHLRQHLRSPGLNKLQLVDTLIQGNVIYFLWYAFS